MNGWIVGFMHWIYFLLCDQMLHDRWTDRLRANCLINQNSWKKLNHSMFTV